MDTETPTKRCAYRGRALSTRNSDGRTVVIHECLHKSTIGKCVDDGATKEALSGASVVVCAGCPLFATERSPKAMKIIETTANHRQASDSDLKWLTCNLRGEPVGEIQAAGCGCDRTIYQCSLKGKCLKKLPTARKLESFGEQLDGVSICSECTDCDSRSVVPVVVIATSHNYGKYLGEGIDSILESSVAVQEIVIVDDKSDPGDETRKVAESVVHPNCKYIRLEHGSEYLSRKIGLEASTAPYVVFLDADDRLGNTYIEECVEAIEADDSIGIATSDLMTFGERSGMIRHTEKNIEQSNWVHSGSMVRRTALSMSGAFDLDPGPHLKTHSDWFVWRRVVRAGWNVARIKSASYEYRQHASSMMAGEMRRCSYYERAGLYLEPITLIVPLCRERYWPRLSAWVERQPEVTDLILIDSSDSGEFRQTVKEWVIGRDYSSVQYIRRPASESLADKDRAADKLAFRQVQLVMPQIYRHIRNAPNEYLMIVEDDVLPPDGAIGQLLQGMDETTAGVSGVVPSRFAEGTAIGGTVFSGTLPMRCGSGLQTVAYTGFACLMLRKSMMLEAAPFHAGGATGNYDIEFCRSVKKHGWKWKLDWSVRCEHGEISSSDSATVECDFVTEDLAVGNAILSQADVRRLKELGITHVLNVAAECDDADILAGQGITLFQNQVSDTPPPFHQPAEWFHRSIEHGLAYRGKLFVHCRGGISRGPSTVYAILRNRGLSSQDAEAMIRRARPQVGLEYLRAAEVANVERGALQE